MKISNEALKVIKSNSRVKAKLMLAFGRTNRAVEIWFEKNSLVLTTPDAITIIKEETGLETEEILTQKV